MLFRLNLIYNRSYKMYYDFSQLVNNTNILISQSNQIIVCFWVTFALLVCALVLNLFRSVKK